MARRRRRRRRARPQRTTTVERRKEGTQHRHGCGTRRSARPTRRRDDTAPPEDLRHYCRTSNSHPARAPPSARPSAVTRGRLHVPITVALRAHSRRSRLARGLGPIDPGEERTKHRRSTHPLREFLQRDVYRQLLALKLDDDVAEVHVGGLHDARALRHLIRRGSADARSASWSVVPWHAARTPPHPEGNAFFPRVAQQPARPIPSGLMRACATGPQRRACCRDCRALLGPLSACRHTWHPSARAGLHTAGLRGALP